MDWFQKSLIGSIIFLCGTLFGFGLGTWSTMSDLQQRAVKNGGGYWLLHRDTGAVEFVWGPPPSAAGTYTKNGEKLD